MLSFILGTAQSGKTYALFKKIGELVEQGKENIYLLVPEQASFECERELLKALGTKNANKVNVVSFTRLCSTVLSELGGLGCKVADEGTRLILLSEALESLKDQLEVYSGFNGIGFAEKLIKDISELKQAAATPEDLLEAAEKVESASLGAKLRDIAAIMQSYDAHLGNRFIDPQDMASLTAYKALQSGWFKGKYLFADGFTGFTGSQYSLLEAAIRDAEQTVFSFTSDGQTTCIGPDIFSNIKKEITGLKAIAEKYNRYGGDDSNIILNRSRATSEELCELELLLRGKKIEAREKSDNIKVVPCVTPRDEAHYIANEICRLVREQGKRWRDFVIITGKDANCEQTVSTIMKQYGIPCFISTNKLLCDLPIARFITAAVSSLQGGYKTEDILSYLKSGLADLSDEEINILEGYVYLWSINGKKWLTDWDMSPYGIDEKKIDPQQLEEEIVAINNLRKRAIEPLCELEKTLKGTAADMVKAVFRFLEKCGTADKLSDYSKKLEEQGEYEVASFQSISWDKLISVLDRITNCICDAPLSAARFTELLTVSLANESVGEIPQRTDEVIFGSADRLRPLRPAVVFIMSANIGIFPSGITNSGLFTLIERNQIKNTVKQLPDRYLAAVTEQNYLFYTAVCSASQAVYVTFSKSNGESELRPSPQVAKICNTFGLQNALKDESEQEGDQRIKVYSFANSTAEKIERPAPAFGYFAMHSRENSSLTASLENALRQLPEYENKLSLLGDRDEQKTISPQNAQRLYSDNMYLSASKLESYYSCPFSYFCRYGLNASAKRKASLDSMVRGTVAHYVFETVLKKYEGNYSALDEDTAFREAKKAVEEYFKKIGADQNKLDAPSLYSLSSLCELIAEVLAFVARDFAQNEFAPAAFELEIDEKGQASPLRVEADNSRVNITGKIDRVDIAKGEKGTDVRIVDYKSAAKTFHLSHVLEGKNMQMLIYLCAVVESKIKLFDNPKPAGILYLQALPSARLEDFKLKPNVFLTDDKETLAKMDAKLSGEFIPVKVTVKNEIDKRSPVVSNEDFEVIFKFVKSKIAQMANELRKGKIAVDPLEIGRVSGCKYCDFRAVCGKEKFDPARTSEKEKLSNAEALEVMREEVSTDGN